MSSNTYGYIADTGPTQAYDSNNGVFDPADINDLIAENKWSGVGTLEFIQTQSVSSATADFTALQENTYNVHFFTFTDVHLTTQTELGYRLSNDSASSYETGYQFANQRGISDGSFAERKSTGQDSARLCGDIDAAAHSLGNGYMYLYNAGDSTKYTFTTSHMVFIDNTGDATMEFGSQLYDHAEQIQAIRFGESTAMSAITSATISLYGIKEYS